jgi:hypothetical protein
MRFRTIADDDPSVLICMLQHLRRNQVAPSSVAAQRRGGGLMEIKIELDDVSDDAFRQLVSEVNEMPMVVAAVAFETDWTYTLPRHA